jgi:UDP:flavonoid glycosyltransferase YjiC (YdhE family)
VNRHLAFVSLPGHGHVTPTLPVVAELVARGWGVTTDTAVRTALDRMQAAVRAAGGAAAADAIEARLA